MSNVKNNNENNESGSALIVKNGQLDGIISDFDTEICIHHQNLTKLLAGEGYFEAEDAVEKLANLFVNGSYRNFYYDNFFLNDEKEKEEFFAKNSELSLYEKKKMEVFFQMLVHSFSFINNYSAFLNKKVLIHLVDAYLAIRTENKLKALITADEYDAYTIAFKEYAQIYKKYNDDAIFNEFKPITSKYYNLQEARQVVGDCMTIDIEKKPSLYHYIKSVEAVNSAGANYLRVFDRETAKVKEIIEKKDELKSIVDDCNRYAVQIKQLYNIGSDPMTLFFDDFDRINALIMDIFSKAIEIIEKFETKKEEIPYAIMHIPSSVKNYADDCSVAVNDPIKEGSNYCLTIYKMRGNLERIVKNIADSLLRN